MKSSDKVVVAKLKKIAIISGVFMAIEILGGYYAHSIAIFADAFHLLSDVIAYVISLLAVLMSYQQSPKGMTFGYQKLQPLGALINVGIIWFVTAELLVEATGRIINKQIVQEPTYMLATSIFGLLCNLYILNILHSDEDAGGHHNCSHSHHKHPHRQHNHEEQHHNHHDHHGHSHSHGSSCSHSHHQKQKESHNHDHHQHGHGDCKGHQHHHQHETPSFGADHSARQFCSHSIKIPVSSATTIMSDEVAIPSLASEEEMRGAQNYHNNINMEAAYIHILTDIILSIGVIVSATIIYFFAPQGHVWSYWQIADPICTYLFSILAIYSTWPIVKQSLVLLLDGCNNPQTVQDIEQELSSNKNVRKVESLKVWSTNRGKLYGALRVKVKKGGENGLLSIFSSRKIEGYVQIQTQQSENPPTQQ